MITFHAITVSLCTDEIYPSTITIVAIVCGPILLLLILTGIITIVCAAVTMNKNKNRGIIMFCFKIQTFFTRCY